MYTDEEYRKRIKELEPIAKNIITEKKPIDARKIVAGMSPDDAYIIGVHIGGLLEIGYHMHGNDFRGILTDAFRDLMQKENLINEVSMTLDVKIGKCVKIIIDGEEITRVRACPMAYHDVCSIEYTLWPRESYRSGSSGFWNFWKNYAGTLYYQMRKHPNTNDIDIAFLKPLLDDINRLPNECGDELDRDRMKWFKFWANRAVKIYGDNACIEFS